MGDNKHNNCSGSQVKWGSSLHSRTRLVNHASALSNPSDQTPTIRFEPRIVVQYFRGKRKASSIYRESEIAQKITATSKNSTAQINYVQLVKIQVELPEPKRRRKNKWKEHGHFETSWSRAEQQKALRVCRCALKSEVSWFWPGLRGARDTTTCRQGGRIKQRSPCPAPIMARRLHPSIPKRILLGAPMHGPCTLT